MENGLSYQQATDQQAKLKDDLEKVICGHGDDLTGLEIVAVMSSVIGYILAYEDTYSTNPQITAEIRRTVVAANISHGHSQGMQTIATDLANVPVGGNA